MAEFLADREAVLLAPSRAGSAHVVQLGTTPRRDAVPSRARMLRSATHLSPGRSGRNFDLSAFPLLEQLGPLKSTDVAILQHKAFSQIRQLAVQIKKGPPKRSCQLCQFRTFSCGSAVYQSYNRSALPQRAGPGLYPPPPREVGATLTPIVAFPCVRTGLSSQILRLLHVRRFYYDARC